MIGALGLLETTGLTPAIVALDTMVKAAAVRLFQLELNESLRRLPENHRLDCRCPNRDQRRTCRSGAHARPADLVDS
jgi:hypothetical protein